ncbi:MAG TPA: shikimate kinase [Egibacteraceae bacterium]|nr:shikimate kinase [Egibacteraceae bacterium]
MSILLPGRNIVLIGLMGAGKTTVGTLLAERLGRPFADTDEMVEAQAHATVAEIFERDGERGFRRLEAAAVRRVAAVRGQVIAVGGGAVLDPANVTHLRATGDLVLLDADPDTLTDRVGDTATRPLLEHAPDPRERMAQLRDDRADVYATAASHTIQTAGRSPEEIADAVLQWAVSQPGLLSRDERDELPS